jgi:hypothetical protein
MSDRTLWAPWRIEYIKADGIGRRWTLVLRERETSAQLSTAASHAPAANTVADSSMTIERPIARTASRVERHADACCPKRRRSSR